MGSVNRSPFRGINSAKLATAARIPAQLVTSAAFGGEDLDVLYVTTARYGLSEQDVGEQPLSGGIFAPDPGVKGLPEVPFAG